MMYVVNPNTLNFFWHSLQEKPKVPNLYAAKRIAKNIAKRGWAFKYDIDEIIGSTDARLNSFEFNLVEFTKLIEIHWQVVFDRPKYNSNEVSGFDAIRAGDLAFLLIVFERLGFRTEPALLVDLFLPTTTQRNKKVLSTSELEIFWYNKLKHKNPPIRLALSEKFSFEQTIGKFRTDDQYLIELIADKTGSATTLKVTPPKFRQRLEPIRTICTQCSIERRKGDSESSAMHRREHKKRMVYLDPKPHLEMIEESKISCEPELVSLNSSLWKHKEMYMRALAFKREFHYDFIQWGSPRDSDLNVHGFLFMNSIGAIIGACCFRRRTKDDKSKYWALDWVWICPSERRKGHLASRWKIFRERFGNFYVTHPVSEEMNAFLAKRNELSLLQIP